MLGDFMVITLASLSSLCSGLEPSTVSSALLTLPQLLTKLFSELWKDGVFAIQAKAHWLEGQWHQFMCKHKLMPPSLSLLFLDSTGFEG
jgi:hypothetical protein